MEYTVNYYYITDVDFWSKFGYNKYCKTEYCGHIPYGGVKVSTGILNTEERVVAGTT